MIELHRLNGTALIVNCELIKFIESTPDTVITLTTGEKMMVLDALDEVVQKATEYRKRLYQEAPLTGAGNLKPGD